MKENVNFSRQSASRLGVRVCSHHLYEEDPGQTDIAVAAVHLHENYDSWTIENDICILDLAEDADISSDCIGVVDLPNGGQEYPAGTMCTVAGWGTTSEGGSLARSLMKVDVPIVSVEDCKDAYGQNDIGDGMICAGYDEGGKDSCQGDSGGPLMCGHGLDGIVSWGYGCAQPGFPGVYTKTASFLSWLQAHM